MKTESETTMSVGEIAAERPAAMAVFERLGLDFCCHGRRSLAEACRLRGLSVREVLEAIDAEEAGKADEAERCWADASMTELADHIERTHHAFAREALARLATLTPRVVKAHGGTDPKLGKLACEIAQLTEEMNDHFVREERVLFPWLRRLERPTEIQSGPPWSVKRPISCMEHDHDDVGAAFARMRALTNNFEPPECACGSYRMLFATLRDLERDMHIHIHKENNILFPAGVRAELAGRPEA